MNFFRPLRLVNLVNPIMRSVSLTTRRDRINRASQPYAANRNHGGGSRRVYVGNLSWEVSWQDLKDHMRSAGNVARADVMQDNSGRSKGCGIVEFSTAREANKAIQTLNDTELKGRKIFVREDREEGGNHATSRNNGGNTQSASFVVTNNSAPSGVVVENLPSNYAWKDLKDIFKAAGFVVRADIITNTSTGSIGVVDFKSNADAKQAVSQFNNHLLGGNVLSVRLRGTESDTHDGDDDDMDHDNDNNADDRSNNADNSVTSRKLYVGQLAWAVTWQTLKDHFKTVGNVIRADVVTDATGRSKGFGTVEFATVEEAQKAVSELNNSTLEGRSIYVREDRQNR